MAVVSYRDLEVWQDGVQLALAIYRCTAAFPGHEQFGLTSQLRRAAVSISSNIAEGYAQGADTILARHLQIAIGSAAEVDTQLIIARHLGYVDAITYQALHDQLTSLIRRMRSFRTKVAAPR